MPRTRSRWREEAAAALLLALCCGLWQAGGARAAGSPAGLFPGMFIFGDSLVDNGNNNFLATLARADFPPNGIDFGPGWPTGRFCNGRTIADYIGLMVGIDPVPAYLVLLQTEEGLEGFTNGVNFASGAAGILDDSGYNYLGRIPMSQQLGYFANLKEDLIARRGEEATTKFLARALYFVVLGSNDYLNNYLQPNSAARKVYSPKAYQDLLVTTFSQQLKAMYTIGARKILLPGVGPLGCIPNELNVFKSANGSCIEDPVNKLVRGYNSAIKHAAELLVKRHKGLHILYADAYKQLIAFTENSTKYGFVNADTSCCGQGNYGAEVPCIPTTPYCKDRDSYVFWDRHHPTDRANYLIANAYVYGSEDGAISPMTILQLAAV
ncbi:hypothetical protein AXG93_4697s1280 [Marchantia polymorpha subsp. ruderalis]|uniref:GDSL esterase/lipase n=2 Tax=Marchantia polymorpha TaxID=3197 RepID=A0A176VQB6_MARPO|nr:hypothetical protein AXG93_4697s1280 [Marchantia polymorpha subsp. ruderalis]